MEKEQVNLSKSVVEDNFEKFSEDSNAAEIAERLGKPAPKKAEVIEPDPPKAELKPEEVEPVKHKAPGRLSFGELRARLRELEAENRGLREGRREPAEVAKPEPAEKAEAKPDQLRKRPQSEDLDTAGKPKYKTWQEYEDDLLAWNEEKILRTLDERQSKKQQETQVAEVNKLIEQSWNDRVEKARTQHPDFDECLDPEIGPGKLIQPGSLVDEWILDSEHGAELLYFFHHHQEELMKFADIKGPTPGARRATARKMLAKIEDRFAVETKPEKTDEPEPEPVRRAPVTRTPPPTREVGGRGAAPIDRARAAVANDDVGAYLDEMNRREIREKFGDRR